jgi:hypothetical protein
MVVADLPYPRVWEAAQRAVGEYPIERAADGWIVTGWRERAPRPDEPWFERLAERVTLRVEPFGERVSRVTVAVEARGRRAGQWVVVPHTEARAREVLARLRDDNRP